MTHQSLAGVDAAVDTLSHEEILGLWLAIALGEDPRDEPGYEKLKHLYTEDDGRRMTQEVERRFCRLAGDRFHKPRGWRPAGRSARPPCTDE